MTTAFAGKSASITWAATTHQMDDWKMEPEADIVEVTNFTSSGYEENIAGIFRMNASFTGPYKGSEGVNQGDSVSVTFAFGGAGPSFTATIRIAKVSLGTNVKDAGRVTYTGKSTGSWTLTGI